MKRKDILVLALIGVIVLCFALSLLFPSLGKQPPIELSTVADVEVIDGGVFDVAEFSYAINLHPNEQKTDAISSSAEAVQAAIDVWHKIYYYDERNKPDGRPNDILSGMNQVEYFHDDAEKCWLVRGVLSHTPYPVAGEVPHIILKSDGTVLAVWIE